MALFKVIISKYLIFPLLIFFTGIVIHTIGIINMLSGAKEFTTWNIWVDVSMLVYSGAMIFGLLFRVRLAYYFSVSGFIIFVLVQFFSYFILSSQTATDLYTAGITVLLCSLAIQSLMKAKRNNVFGEARN